MRLPKLSNPCCAMPVLEMPAAIPYSKGQSNSSHSSERKTVKVATPRIPNSSRKNTPLPCGISSMPASASTPSIHSVSWESLSRSPGLVKPSHEAYQDTEKTFCPTRRRRPRRLGFSFQHFSSFLRASCMPDSSASPPSKIPLWI
jgi:hypothetical protein